MFALLVLAFPLRAVCLSICLSLFCLPTLPNDLTPQTVVILTASNGNVIRDMVTGDANHSASLAWSPHNHTHLAVGAAGFKIKIIDVSTGMYCTPYSTTFLFPFHVYAPPPTSSPPHPTNTPSRHTHPREICVVYKKPYTQYILSRESRSLRVHMHPCIPITLCHATVTAMTEQESRGASWSGAAPWCGRSHGLHTTTGSWLLAPVMAPCAFSTSQLVNLYVCFFFSLISSLVSLYTYGLTRHSLHLSV